MKGYQNGKAFSQDYIRGIAQHDIVWEDLTHPSGMEIMLKPDENIFGPWQFSKSQIDAWVKENCRYGKILIEAMKE